MRSMLAVGSTDGLGCSICFNCAPSQSNIYDATRSRTAFPPPRLMQSDSTYRSAVCGDPTWRRHHRTRTDAQHRVTIKAARRTVMTKAKRATRAAHLDARVAVTQSARFQTESAGHAMQATQRCRHEERKPVSKKLHQIQSLA